MKIVLFGATGMIGQGLLRACLADPDVESVLAVGRSASGSAHPKVRDLVVPRTRLYRIVYRIAWPLYPLLRAGAGRGDHDVRAGAGSRTCRW